MSDHHSAKPDATRRMIPTNPPGTFGATLDLPAWITSSRTMIVGLQSNSLQPERLLLPHQLYAKDIPGLLDRCQNFDPAVLVTPLVQPWLVVAGREAGTIWPNDRAPVDVARLQREHADLRATLAEVATTLPYGNALRERVVLALVETEAAA